MFKFLPLLVLGFLASGYALPVAEEKEFVAILKSEVNKNEDGSYQVNYEGADGTERKEEASVVDAGTENETLEVKGSYKYINDKGETVEVFYTAGVNGFVPYGTIINPEITSVAEAAKDLPNTQEDEVKS